ncbi:MAG: hypothetical protein GY795_29675 [Desulfobacterales bacterium]|nr:hypothetical protein [Desulfobacterales bacterium]
MKKILNKKIIGSATVFCVCIVIFFINYKYYIPSTLLIAEKNETPATLWLSWDSGQGFNKNERTSFILDNKKIQKLTLPQLHIKGIKLQADNPAQNFRIELLKIVSENKEILLPINKDKLNHPVEFSDLDLGTSKFHPVLFFVQLFSAFLFGWLFYEASLLYEKFSGQTFSSKIKDLFFHEKRPVFWSMFLLSSGVYSLWLMGQWPGYMTIDSFSTWLQAKTLVFGGLHPIVYSIYTLALMQIADSPATVAVFQILAASALGSYIFYFCVKKGVPFILVFLFFSAFTLSVPNNVYNITLWKDIPFSMLVIFWGFYIFYLGFEKKHGNPLEFSLKKLIVLSSLLVLTSTIRHNGIIYLAFIPLLLLALRLMPLKTWAYFILSAFILFVAVKTTTTFLDKSRPGEAKKFFTFSCGLNPIAAILSKDWYLSEDHNKDREIIEKLVKIEDLKKSYNPRTALSACSTVYMPISEENEEKRLKLYYSFSTQKNPLSKEDSDKIQAMYYRIALANLPVFLADRTLMFFSALGPNAIMLHGNSLEYRSVIENVYKNPGLRKLAYSPKSGFLEKIIKKVIGSAHTYNGLTGQRFIMWNAYLPFILFLTVLFLYKWVPLSALYSCVIMLQVPFLFILLPESDFRYTYFIYSGGFFIIPLVWAEIANRE